ncbi:DUF2490 domain-containing protein [Flavobacterium suzhouense]|uniref:DUF2490 domain-containing protein n=1 Tax=Flavobacterium suzhouense TaxID=1529638 RepID=A0ABW5NRW1_9FLAO
MKKIFLSLLLLLNLCALTAQTRKDFTGWGAVFASYKLNDKLSIHFDAQLRSSDEWEKFQSVLLRPGLNYNINSKSIATVGYAYIDTQRSKDGIAGWIPEHRIWQQYIYKQGFNLDGRNTSLQHRLRLEERFVGMGVVENNQLIRDDFEFALRLRYFARMIMPLQKTDNFTKGAFVAFQDELLFNIQNNDKITNGKVFDQNRAYVALGWRFSSKFDLEAGYMNQYVVGRSLDVSNSIIQLAGYVRM